jgi:hypothetical protein
MSRDALAVLLCLLALAGPARAGDEPAPTVDALTSDAVAAAPRWSATGEPSATGYRVSLARGGLDLGLDFQRRAATHLVDARHESPAPAGTMLPALSFGLRSVSAPAPASTLVDRTWGSGAVPSVSRVGIEYKPARSQVFLNHGLGFRLSGDDRVTMRLRKGSLGVYLKRNF